MPRGICRGEYEPKPPEEVLNRLMHCNRRLTSDEMRLLSRKEHWKREERIRSLDISTLSEEERKERKRVVTAICMRKRLKDPRFKKERYEYNRSWAKKNRSRIVANYLEYTKRTSVKRKAYRSTKEYLEKVPEYAVEYKKRNPRKYRDSLRRWRSKNPSYAKMRYYTVPDVRILSLCRTRIRTVLKEQGDHKTMRSHKYLGCDSKTLIKHIASHLKDGMKMEDILSGDVEIHHRIPPTRLAHDPEAFLKSLRYTNLVPLWKKENRKRYNSIWPDTALEAIEWGIKLTPFEIKKAIKAGVKITL